MKDNADIRAEVDNRLRQGLGLPVLERIETKPKGEKADVVQIADQKKKA
jgi:hypothetical protein